jgi:hypothetical protein
MSEIFDVLFVDLQLNRSSHLIVGATYIPPYVDVGVYERYCYITCDTLDKCCDSLIVVCGDFNFPNTTWSTIDNNMTYY